MLGEVNLFIYLGFYITLNTVQVRSGHITTGSWKGRGNQYIQLIKVLYCKLPTIGKQLPAFTLEAVPRNQTPASEVGGESVTTLPPWPRERSKPLFVKKSAREKRMNIPIIDSSIEKRVRSSAVSIEISMAVSSDELKDLDSNGQRGSPDWRLCCLQRLYCQLFNRSQCQW